MWREVVKCVLYCLGGTYCHGLSVSLSCFGVLPVFTLVSVLFLPMSSFPPV